MWIVILLLAAGLAALVLKANNLMRQHKETLKESLSNISVVTSKKNSLVNQLIAIVQSYQESEKFTMLKVSSDSTTAAQGASAMPGAVVADLGRMGQRFPDLKSNQQYNRLMDALQGSEQEVQYARTAYNHNAKVYNTARSSVPAVFFAALLGFEEAQYLAIGASEDPGLRVQTTMSSPDAERVNVLIGSQASPSLAAPAQAIARQRDAALVAQPVTGTPGTDAIATGKFCQACGAQNAGSASFCGACGAKF